MELGMANRQSAMTIDAFALEEELNELLQAETSGRRSVGRKDSLGSKPPSETKPAQVAGLEHDPKALAGESNCPTSRRREESSRRRIHRSARVLGGSGNVTSSYTWASGTQGSIFSLPVANASVSPPPRAVTRSEVDNSLSPGLRRMRSQATLRSQASYSLFPSPSPPTDREFAQELFRTNFENIHGSPDYLGRYPTPFPVVDSEQLLVLQPQQVTPMNEAPGQERRARECLAPVMGFWRGLGKFFVGLW